MKNRHHCRVVETLESKAQRSGRPVDELIGEHTQRHTPFGFDPSEHGHFDQFKLLEAKEAAEEVRLSLPGFWKQVRHGRLPKPLYPAPRWLLGELRAALLATRCLPADQMAARRHAKIDRERTDPSRETCAPRGTAG